MYPIMLLCQTAEGEAPGYDFKWRSDVNEKEIFLLSGRDEGESVAKNGEFEGLGINEIIKRLGGENAETLPVYIKLIKTKERMPVKVYPDDEYAAEHSSVIGKTSLVYITDAAKGAEMVYGLSRSVSRDELNRRVTGGSLSQICNFVNVQKGDVFFIPPGVVFAIGGGISAIEISVNSDSEYIISDYGREYGGSTRPLQVNRALDVMKPQKIDIAYGNIGDLTLFPFGTVRELCKTERFSVDALSVDGNVGIYEEEGFSSIVVTSGEADASYSTGTMRLKEGDSVLLPKGVKIRLSGRVEMLYTKTGVR